MSLGGAALPPNYAFSLEQSLDISSSVFVSRLSRACPDCLALNQTTSQETRYSFSCHSAFCGCAALVVVGERAIRPSSIAMHLSTILVYRQLLTHPGSSLPMPYLVRARFLLAMLAGGLWLIAFNAYAQSSGAGRASHFRNQSNQQGIEPFAFYGFGAPLAGIATHPADLANFNNGLLNFQEVETLNPASAPSGPLGQLGPLFNNTSCAACHSNSARGSGGLDLVEQRLSMGGPPIWELAADHMLFGGQLSQGDREFIYRFGQTAPPLGAEIGIPDNTPSACQYVEYARDFSQNLIDFSNILLCRRLPVGAQNSIPPDLRMLLNLDLFRPQLQLDKPRQEDPGPDTSMLDQIRTLNALGYLDGDTYMNAGTRAAASEDEQPPAPASSQEPPK
jgi:hypothetical protein